MLYDNVITNNTLRVLFDICLRKAYSVIREGADPFARVNTLPQLTS